MTMQQQYVLTFSTRHPINPEIRRQLKELLGDVIRDATYEQTDVAIDQEETER